MKTHMKPTRRRSAWGRVGKLVAGASAAVLLMAGCTGAEGESGSGEVVEGGTVVAALSGDPMTLDMAQNSGSLTIRVGLNIFEQLVASDENYETQPALAESIDKSDDGLKYTFHLREGVKFHNGDTMTSADVVASLQRWTQVSGTGKLAGADIASMEAPDENTVVLNMARVRYSMIDDLAYVVQAAIIVPEEVATAAGTTPMADDQIIGTGPYKLKSYEHGQSVVLERNDDYAPDDAKASGLTGKKEAHLDEVDFRFVTDPSQQLNGLKSGQFQWAQSVSADEYPTLKEDPQIEAVVSPTGLIATVLINHNENSAFKDLKARQGLNMLIDKKAMSQASFGPEEFWSPLDGALVFKEDKPMYSDAGKDIYEKYDEEEAKALIEESGLDTSKPIRIFTTQTYPKYYQMAVVLQAQLEKIGLTADVQVYDFPTMIEKLSSDPTGWDISFTSFSGTVGSPAQITPLTPSWPGEFQSPALDELMAKYSASTDAESAKAVVDDIQQLVWDELPVISVAPNKTLLTWSSKLQDVSHFTQGIFWNCYLTE